MADEWSKIVCGNCFSGAPLIHQFRAARLSAALDAVLDDVLAMLCARRAGYRPISMHAFENEFSHRISAIIKLARWQGDGTEQARLAVQTRSDTEKANKKKLIVFMFEFRAQSGRRRPNEKTTSLFRRCGPNLNRLVHQRTKNQQDPKRMLLF